jgi:CBS domain-containing protein
MTERQDPATFMVGTSVAERTSAKAEEPMIATIEQFMTPMPQTIAADQTLAAAGDLMRSCGVRHLPVCDPVEGGRVVGVVSLRDLERAEEAKDTRRLYTPVREVMRTEPWCVAPDASLVSVVREMADRKVGSALVVAGGRAIGIFTGVDAARVLADLVENLERDRRSDPQQAR